MQLEKIPLIDGRYYRCLKQNGESPCAPEIVSALEQDSKRAASFTPEEKAKAAAAREGRSIRRHAFWTDFPNAFRFQQAGPDHLLFAPLAAYRPQRDPDTSFLRKIEGELWYNPQTYEITRMDYRMLADSEDSYKLTKGSSFSVTLAEMTDRHYFPLKTTEKRVMPKGEIDTTQMEFANFKSFATDSSITFIDKDHY